MSENPPVVQLQEGYDGTAAEAAEDPRRVADEAAAILDELKQKKEWEAAVDRFYPVAEKVPAAAAGRTDLKVRSRVAFCLGQIGRLREAVDEMKICVERFPNNFMYRASLGYCAYNALWAEKNREIRLSPEERADMRKLAHENFAAAQELRPDGVTNFYRQGMLWSRLEDKPAKGLPLFQRAIRNWDGLTPPEREARKQEKKNLVKSLYQAASAELRLGFPERALAALSRCMNEDEKTDYLQPLFKRFALGKIQFHRGEAGDAAAALEWALEARRGNQPVDFVYELLGRCRLALGDATGALEAARRVPERFRRPYVRWTEGDALIALERTAEARNALAAALDKDRLGKHKTLIRLARLEYAEGRFDPARRCAIEAGRFFREKWGKLYAEAGYWEAMAALALGEAETARGILTVMEKEFPDFGRVAALRAALAEAAA
jgi:predicted negative regulator of RcsB-dependent stress response